MKIFSRAVKGQCRAGKEMCQKYAHLKSKPSQENGGREGRGGLSNEKFGMLVETKPLKDTNLGVAGTLFNPK